MPVPKRPDVVSVASVDDDFMEHPSERIAFIGVGQGGNRIVDNLWKIGYRRIVAVNTSAQDLTNINIPTSNQVHMDIGVGGAGRDATEGKKAFVKYYDYIYNTCRTCFGDGIDRIYIVASLGGGTGTGGLIPAIKLSREYLNNINETDKNVGIMVTLPRRDDGVQEKRNANVAIESILPNIKTELNDDEKEVLAANGLPILRPTIILDNEVAHSFFKSLSLSQYWNAVNEWFTDLFHAFNIHAARHGDDVFDGADYRRILNSGVVAFGASEVGDYQEQVAISKAIDKDLENAVLFRNFELSNATIGGLILECSAGVMDNMPQDNVVYAQNYVLRNMKEGAVLLKGVYQGSAAVRNEEDKEDARNVLDVYYIFGGLDISNLTF